MAKNELKKSAASPDLDFDLELQLAAHKKKVDESQRFVSSLCDALQKHNYIAPSNYEKYSVKRGLRNADGTGVMAGVTQIGSVEGYFMRDGEKLPEAGRLYYRGIDVADLVQGFRAEDRFGFEETVYLLLFGALPNAEQLDQFCQLLTEWSELPQNFSEDMILKAPSRDVMNKLARSVLALYSYDPEPEKRDLEAELLQIIRLVARCPLIVAHSYAAKQHYFDNMSLYLHRPQPELSIAENFLYSFRQDNRFTRAEARLLDLALVLHAEHGGGNNSAFACRVVSSTGTDLYSAIASAISSLKGPKHGGANMKVMEMMDALKKGVHDWKDDDAVRGFLSRLLNKEAGDRSGLIYGMGHAVYTISDPRAIILKECARDLAAEKGMTNELELLESVERLAPQVLSERRGESAATCANVDLYSGLIYKMIGLPVDLYTPLFAIARMSGWCAHRIEEVYNPGNKIIRPAYKAVGDSRPYVPMDKRSDS